MTKSQGKLELRRQQRLLLERAVLASQRQAFGAWGFATLLLFGGDILSCDKKEDSGGCQV